MIKLWAARIERGMSTIDEVPPVYLNAVKAELGIEDPVAEQEEPVESLEE